MSSASFRKIGFFGPGRRLAAPEAPKIAGGASLARRENLIPGHPSGGRVLRFLGRPEGLQGERSNLAGCPVFSR